MLVGQHVEQPDKTIAIGHRASESLEFRHRTRPIARPVDGHNAAPCGELFHHAVVVTRGSRVGMQKHDRGSSASHLDGERAEARDNLARGCKRHLVNITDQLVGYQGRPVDPGAASRAHFFVGSWQKWVNPWRCRGLSDPTASRSQRFDRVCTHLSALTGYLDRTVPTRSIKAYSLHFYIDLVRC